jgi:ferrous iron transport protein A
VILKTILEMKKGQTIIVKKINSDEELKNRLNSFGLSKGVEVTLENCSPNRENLEIGFNGIHLALRKSEAKAIEVVSD